MYMASERTDVRSPVFCGEIHITTRVTAQSHREIPSEKAIVVYLYRHIDSTLL